MKNKLKKNLKKIGTFFLSLLTLFSSLFGGLAGMPTPITNVSAKEGTATVSMSKARGSFGIRELGRASSEGLWKINGDEYLFATAIHRQAQGLAGSMDATAGAQGSLDLVERL